MKRLEIGNIYLTLFGITSACFSTFWLHFVYERYVFFNDIIGQLFSALFWTALNISCLMLIEFQLRDMRRKFKWCGLLLLAVSFTLIILLVQFSDIPMSAGFITTFILGAVFCLLPLQILANDIDRKKSPGKLLWNLTWKGIVVFAILQGCLTRADRIPWHHESIWSSHREGAYQYYQKYFYNDEEIIHWKEGADITEKVEKAIMDISNANGDGDSTVKILGPYWNKGIWAIVIHNGYWYLKVDLYKHFLHDQIHRRRPFKYKEQPLYYALRSTFSGLSFYYDGHGFYYERLFKDKAERQPPEKIFSVDELWLKNLNLERTGISGDLPANYEFDQLWLGIFPHIPLEGILPGTMPVHTLPANQIPEDKARKQNSRTVIIEDLPASYDQSLLLRKGRHFPVNLQRTYQLGKISISTEVPPYNAYGKVTLAEDIYDDTGKFKLLYRGTEIDCLYKIEKSETQVKIQLAATSMCLNLLRGVAVDFTIPPTYRAGKAGSIVVSKRNPLYPVLSDDLREYLKKERWRRNAERFFVNPVLSAEVNLDIGNKYDRVKWGLNASGELEVTIQEGYIMRMRVEKDILFSEYASPTDNPRDYYFYSYKTD